MIKITVERDGKQPEVIEVDEAIVVGASRNGSLSIVKNELPINTLLGLLELAVHDLKETYRAANFGTIIKKGN